MRVCLTIHMKKIQLIGIGILVLVILALGTGIFLKDKFAQEVSFEEPVDIVMEFYSPWLNAMQSTSTNPYAEGLVDYPILSRDLRKELKEMEGQNIDGMYPVLCQQTVPLRISTRRIYEEGDRAQILVMAKDEGLYGQAIITLNKLNEGWYIDSIKCSPGEFAPEKEFSFEREGIIIKETVTEPYNNQYWHLVYEENGAKGLLVPLFFDQETKCIPKRGDEYICDPSQFKEDSKVTIRAQLTEAGAEVKRVEYR